MSISYTNPRIPLVLFDKRLAIQRNIYIRSINRATINSQGKIFTQRMLLSKFLIIIINKLHVIPDN